jgi:hypothetical protein
MSRNFLEERRSSVRVEGVFVVHIYKKPTAAITEANHF